MLRLRADARRSTQLDDHRLFLACDSDRTRCTKNSAVSRAEMYGAGLSDDLRGPTYFVQAGARKNPGQDLALPEKRDLDVGQSCKEAASTLRKNLKALPLPFPLDWTVERGRPESSVSIGIQLLLPAVFPV